MLVLAKGLGSGRLISCPQPSRWAILRLDPHFCELMCRNLGSERLSEPFGLGRGISLVFVRAVEFFLSSFLLTSSMVVADFSNLLCLIVILL